MEKATADGDKKCLQLKFRNVRRVCLSSAIFREFASCTVVNTKTREMGMMLMCIVEGGGAKPGALDADQHGVSPRLAARHAAAFGLRAAEQHVRSRRRQPSRTSSSRR